MKTILLLSASTGSGHTRAAEALTETAKADYPDLNVVHIDVLDYVSSPVKKAIFHSYDVMIKQIPELWSLLYKRSDNPKLMKRLRALTKKINSFNATKLYDYVEELQPDYILATHFYGAQLIFSAPAKRQPMPKVGLVMTDYEKHAFLQMPGLDHYFVSTDRMKAKFERLGIQTKRIDVTGIPVSPLFTEQCTTSSARKDLQLPDKKTMLLLSGGQGMANIDTLCEALATSEEPLSLIAVAGKNKRLKTKLEQIQSADLVSISVLGWTDQIHKYIAAADVVITKPGGLTTSECIAMQKPILATSPIPGQEKHNAEYIIENQYGHVIHSVDDLMYYTAMAPSRIAPGYQTKDTAHTAASRILDIVSKK